ncbi:10908_t:CDS:1 [Funneliformis geosporum]|uniref:1034_t:CDS:1 n=1 Tax=Funneliformis geosporum TaxID=1117311 RepID=A0A9W4WPZ0_9GLOM|nr:1034_t:CDS:1 [Funneliformis geosporum]CAI2163482.1 10908_t:CDS:1 [Funneliformis geosporum]
MFLLKRQVLRLPFKELRRVSYRNVHQKQSENSKNSTLKYGYGVATTLLGIGVITLFYGFQRKGQQTYNSSSLNDKEEDGGRNSTIIRSPREATAKLRENQISFLLQRSNGIWRYDSNQLGSNYPIEDMKSEEFVFNSPKRNKVESLVGDRLFFGVYDGHGGWNTSKFLSKTLIPKVREHLDKAIEGTGEYSNLISNYQELTKAAIEKAFVELDDEIIIHSINRLLNTKGLFSIEECLLSAFSGSCALLAYIDAANKDLYVACTGDSRAVLGVRETDNENGGKRWKAVVLTEDQTGRNENEVKRIDKEHPGEEGNIISYGRVFGGLEPTRAFGDSKYKWDVKMQDGVFTKFFKIKRGLAGGSKNKSPPYVTARPEITSHKLTENVKFLVLATDGLWDALSNEEVVELVGEFLDGRRDIIDDEKENSSNFKEDELKWENSMQEKVFTFVDENASTHLIRNACGGAKQDQLCALLSLPSPMSRRFIDDITVTVVFFGPDNQSNKTSGKINE